MFLLWYAYNTEMQTQPHKQTFFPHNSDSGGYLYVCVYAYVYYVCMNIVYTYTI
jgi:hypothetical protein